MEDSKLENVIRKLAIAVGIAMLLASIYLSYDGFDQSVSGDNPNYTILAVAIGYTLAVAFTLAEFIITSRSDRLNSTLKWLGVLAYGYSIITNYLGLEHLLQMNIGMALMTAVVMDVFPEQMIAWGLGEAVMHDLFGNLGKFATAPISPKKNNGGGGGGGQGQGKQKQQNQQQHHSVQPSYRMAGGGGGGGFDPRRAGFQRRAELEKSRGNNQKPHYVNMGSQEESDDYEN